MDVASHVQGKPKETNLWCPNARKPEDSGLVCPSLGCQPCLEVINYTSILTHPVEVSLLHADFCLQVCFNPFKGSNGSPWIVPLPFVGISVSQNTNGPSKSGDSHKKERQAGLKPSPNSDSISGAFGSRPESVPAKTPKSRLLLGILPSKICVCLRSCVGIVFSSSKAAV